MTSFLVRDAARNGRFIVTSSNVLHALVVELAKHSAVFFFLQASNPGTSIVVNTVDRQMQSLLQTDNAKLAGNVIVFQIISFKKLKSLCRHDAESSRLMSRSSEFLDAVTRVFYRLPFVSPYFCDAKHRFIMSLRINKVLSIS